MIRFYTFFTLLFSYILLVSFSTNPPDGKTGAPGDSLCIECHTQTTTTLGGTISVEGFPSSITPNQTYTLTVVNRNTVGNAVRGGFQMTILGQFNTKAGSMTNPSTSSVVSNSLGRQYFEHNPSKTYPDSNVVRWTVDWTAPELAAGSVVTYYIAGNIANGNFQETGDRVVTSTGTGSILLSSVETLNFKSPLLYPNPGLDRLRIELDDDLDKEGRVLFYNASGVCVKTSTLSDEWMLVDELPSGLYILQIIQGESTYTTRWAKM